MELGTRPAAKTNAPTKTQKKRLVVGTDSFSIMALEIGPTRVENDIQILHCAQVLALQGRRVTLSLHYVCGHSELVHECTAKELPK